MGIFGAEADGVGELVVDFVHVLVHKRGVEQAMAPVKQQIVDKYAHAKVSQNDDQSGQGGSDLRAEVGEGRVADKVHGEWHDHKVVEEQLAHSIVLQLLARHCSMLNAILREEIVVIEQGHDPIA